VHWWCSKFQQARLNPYKSSQIKPDCLIGYKNQKFLKQISNKSIKSRLTKQSTFYFNCTAIAPFEQFAFVIKSLKVSQNDENDVVLSGLLIRCCQLLICMLGYFVFRLDYLFFEIFSEILRSVKSQKSQKR
jgi:hypothetical protein